MKQLRDDKAATQQKCCSPAFLNASENVFSCKPSTRARCYTIFLQSWQTAAAPPVGYPVQPLIARYKLIGQNICHALVSPPRFYCSLTCHHFCRLTDSHIRKWSRQFLTTLHHSHAVLCILVGTPHHSTSSPVVSYLCCHMDVGSFLQKQGHHVSVTFLGGQMKWGHSLFGQNVGLSPVVQ